MKRKLLVKVMSGLLIASVIAGSNPVTADAATWKRNNVGWWWQEDDGSYPANSWLKTGGRWYWFNSRGYMETGWELVRGKWYYMNSSGAMTTGWQKVNGKWYYMNSSGAMTTGWQKVNGRWYYMNSSGAMTTGWQKVNGKWYYMNSSGAMTTGWQLVSGKWYYMNSSGAMEANRWVGNYYVGGSGAMLTSQWVGRWYVGASGAWIPNYENHSHTWVEDTKTVTQVVTPAWDEVVYKTVHHDAETIQKWVVDRPAWDETVIETVHHDAEYEWQPNLVEVVIKEAWDEEIYELRDKYETTVICNGCHEEFSSANDYFYHANILMDAGDYNHGGYHTIDTWIGTENVLVDVVKHDAVTEIQDHGSNVFIKEAYDEEVPKTVTHPEEGHYETVITRDAWDEQVPTTVHHEAVTKQVTVGTGRYRCYCGVTK